MMFHDKLKMMATLAGVIFSVILANQGAGTFLGLLHKNTMLVESAGADLWIVPPLTQTLQGGKTLPDAVLMAARTTPGVTWAEPVLYGNATLALPGGGSEAVTVIGTRYPAYRGGPWNMVRGSREVLAEPDTMIFEDFDREKFGNLDLGSVRELNGRNVRAGGFTYGLIPFGPSYAFADYDLARLLLKQDSDRVSYVIVKVAPGSDIARVKADLQARTPDATVMTTKELSASVVQYVLVSTSLGITIGSSTVVAIVVGFLIVGLSMFSSVVDNLREFGTLKAIGATTWDLGFILFTQAVTFALGGTVIGLAAISKMADGIRSATMTFILPGELFLATFILMLVLCTLASSLSLLRLRKLEPAMVFQ